MGKQAARMTLDQAVSGNGVQMIKEKLPTHIVIRESSRINR
jgi:DNA-binding LacI/PurR family transcriptional regulator